MEVWRTSNRPVLLTTCILRSPCAGLKDTPPRAPEHLLRQESRRIYHPSRTLSAFFPYCVWVNKGRHLQLFITSWIWRFAKPQRGIRFKDALYQLLQETNSLFIVNEMRVTLNHLTSLDSWQNAGKEHENICPGWNPLQVYSLTSSGLFCFHLTCFFQLDSECSSSRTVLSTRRLEVFLAKFVKPSCPPAWPCCAF